jgi:type I restriction enzyme S subunit
MNSGWLSNKLGNLCEIELGRTPSRAQSVYWDDRRETGNVWLSIADLLNAEDNIVVDSREYVSAKGAELCKLVSNGTLLVSFKLTLGRLAFAGRDLFTNEAIAALTPLSGSALSKEFLFYFLQYFDWVKAAEHDVKLKGMTFNKAKLKEIEVHFPAARSEQQRIVRILDEAFEGIATAKANAEQNRRNARGLFESHLQSEFSRRSCSWVTISLEALLEREWIESHLDGNHGGDYPRKEEFVREGIPYISAMCIDDDERIDMSRAKYLLPARAALLRKGIAKNNDVLFAHNATVGPVAVLRTDEEKVILGTSLTYYRCNPRYILPEYLAHYMRSFAFKKQYLQVMRQSTRNQVPITKQREFYHVIPPIDEQKRMIVALDALLESGRGLTRVYEQKLAALEELKKSLLHQAFTGQL